MQRRMGKTKNANLCLQRCIPREVIHAQASRPSDFKGKRAVVLGLGNNAADISTALVGHASKIYLAHRRGANLVSLLLLKFQNPANHRRLATSNY